MKYKVTFIEPVEDRDSVFHGGVLFPIGEAVEIDSEKTPMSPWFEGNRSFLIEETDNEATKDQDQHDDDSTGSGAAGGSEETATVDQETTPAVVKPKRVRRKTAGK